MKIIKFFPFFLFAYFLGGLQGQTESCKREKFLHPQQACYNYPYGTGGCFPTEQKKCHLKYYARCPAFACYYKLAPDGASIPIPLATKERGRQYFEDKYLADFIKKNRLEYLEAVGGQKLTSSTSTTLLRRPRLHVHASARNSSAKEENQRRQKKVSRCPPDSFCYSAGLLKKEIFICH